MDIEMVAGQHVQRGIVRQSKAERLGVVGIAMNCRELVRRRRLRLDACYRDHAAIIRVRHGSRNRDSLSTLQLWERIPAIWMNHFGFMRPKSVRTCAFKARLESNT